MDTGSSFLVGGAFAVDRRYQLATQTLTGSKLPTTGTQDGTVLRYKATAVATGAQADVWWTFIYDATDGYWYYDRGAPLVTYAVSGAGETTTSTSYVAPTTTTIVTLPFAGDYMIALAAVMNSNTVTDGVACSYTVGATAASNAWAVFNTGVAATTDVEYGRPYYLHTGVLAGDTIQVRHQVFTGGTGATAHRQLNILPLRVH